MPFEEHLARLHAVYEQARLAGARTLPPLPTTAERLLALQRRASRRQSDAAGTSEALEKLKVEATTVVQARDVELRRLYDSEVGLRAELAVQAEVLRGAEASLRAEVVSLGEELAQARKELDAERYSTGATRGQLESLLARRSVRLALRLSRLLGRS
jgi:hypothetical protein